MRISYSFLHVESGKGFLHEFTDLLHSDREHWLCAWSCVQGKVVLEGRCHEDDRLNVDGHGLVELRCLRRYSQLRGMKYEGPNCQTPQRPNQNHNPESRSLSWPQVGHEA